MSQNTLDVVVIGNAGVDTNVYFYGREPNFNTESNFTEDLDYVGQAGGYTSRGFAQLGKKTAFIGYVGDDHNGRFVREEFARDGIDTTALFIDAAGTSRSINFMYPDGRRKNFYDGKNHMRLQPNLTVCRAVLSRARLALFHLPNWARHLLPVAKEQGMTIACDLQDVTNIHDEYRQEFIHYADFVFFSTVNHADPRPLIETCLRRNPRQVVVAGMGAQGCALGTQQGVRFFPPVTMIPEPVVDTNGAGDALAVGLLTSFVLESYPLDEAVRRAQIAARYTCTLKANSSHLITRDKLEALARL